MSNVRRFLAAEIALFFAAALVHAGILLGGFEHGQARTAEAVLGALLLGALIGGLLLPASARRFAFWAQAIALAGTLVGVTMIAIGVGPRSLPDVLLHAVLLILLGFGLRASRRGR